MLTRRAVFQLVVAALTLAVLFTLAASFTASEGLFFAGGGRGRGRGRFQKPNLYKAAQALGLATTPMAADFDESHAAGEDVPARREEITLMTFNIRYDELLAPGYPNPPGPDVTLPASSYGEFSWAARRFAVSDIALFHNPDIVVFQEVLHNQLLDLAYLLGEDYGWVGVGRDDGKEAGEAVPVFYKKDKFVLASLSEGGIGEKGFEHFWLSNTPSIPASVGWDAALTRMCTHLALKLRPPPGLSATSYPSLRAAIHVLSTHYDHRGLIARAKSSDLIVEKASSARKNSRSITGLEPLVIVAGDLNSPREEKGWQNLVRGHHGVPTSKSARGSFSFYDLQLANPTRFGLPYATRYYSPPDEKVENPSANPPPGQPNRGILSTNFGPSSSFTDWGEVRDRTPPEDRIDFLLVGDNQPVVSGEKKGGAGWRVKTAGVVSSWSSVEGGIRASDHRPVIARLRWEV